MCLEWKNSLDQCSILVYLVETKYLFCLKIVHKILSLRSTTYFDNLVLQNSLFKDLREEPILIRSILPPIESNR